MFGRDKIQEFLERAVSELKRKGLEGEIICYISEEATIRSAWGEIHQSPLAKSISVTINGRNGLKNASISFGELKISNIKSSIKAIKEFIKFSPENLYIHDLPPQPRYLPELFLPALDEKTIDHALDLKVSGIVKAHKEARKINLSASGRFFFR